VTFAGPVGYHCLQTLAAVTSAAIARAGSPVLGGEVESLPLLNLVQRQEVLMRSQPLIAVTDVEASSRWYQRLLGCKSAHGGPEYERLVANGALILQLHRFDVEHHHGPIGDPDDRPYGNGVLLWFEIDDFEDAIARATEMNARVILPRHRNPLEGDGGPNHWECWLRDPDGYIVVLASPDGSANGNWRPASSAE